MASQPQSESSSLLISAVKLAIILCSLSLASIAGYYLHPFLLPVLTEAMPHLWSILQGWFTAPFLFVLLNFVVGALYLSSKRMPRDNGEPDGTQTDDGNPDVREGLVDGKRPTAEEAKPGIRARFEGKPFTRLVRSKSEQIAAPVKRTEHAGSRLKKAGTFESTSHSPAAVKPVVVADLPEDEQPPAGSEEVDKKAEDFIGRFYQRMKLQRLDSLLRNQQS